MSAAAVVLIFVNLLSADVPRGMENFTPLKRLSRARWDAWLLLMTLLSCCLFGDLCEFVGSLATFGCIFLVAFGHGDARYAAKKFAACHFLALILCACAEILAKAHPFGESQTAAPLYAIAFGILTAAYPLNNWTDSFFSRAPSYFLSIWLVIVRPLVASLLLTTIGCVPLQNASRLACEIAACLAFASLLFVPILFFAKVELQRIVSLVTSWQSGYLWLFALHFSEKFYDAIVLFAITQGIFIAIISHVASALTTRGGTDSIGNLSGLFESDYFSAVFVASSFVFLMAMPIVFIVKNFHSDMSLTVIYAAAAGTILPSIFCHKICALMKKSSATPDGNGTPL
ncbi:MAG: hypothetical protein LBT64_00460 [Puniceicoccales bacterium]|jgi:NADH:ubiquinone oxidoreductase subunit 4 (subunit M)|nr:hypothetical protein [Puniceicoccales bacterium]